MIQTKVKAATVTAGVTSLVVYLLGHYVFKTDTVPDVVKLIADVGVTGGATFVAGYWTRHKADYAWLEKVLKETGVEGELLEDVLNTANLPTKISTK